MTFDALPVWLFFVGTILFVMFSTEVGYRLGHRSRRRSAEEKESPVSAIAGSILGLSAFMLAFTFGIVANRYDARKALVREEANSIGTTYLRTDFIPEPARTETRQVLRDYVDKRLAFVQTLHTGRMTEAEIANALANAGKIQGRLWAMAVVNARKDMDSDVAALYIDSLNGMIDLHATRVAVGLQARIPGGIWIALLSLTFLGMVAIGYQMAIAGSKRSLAQSILAISFSMVITLIASLDRPESGYVTVSQQPMISLRDFMAAGSDQDGKQQP
jgi:hypothetical protein